MAKGGYKHKTRASKRKSRGAPGGKVRVKGHTRSPRGPNAGKHPVFVKGYRRRLPRTQ